MKKILISFCAVFTVLVSAIACSPKSTTVAESNAPTARQQQKTRQGEPPKWAELLDKMDSNKDGKLSKEEVKGPLAKDFAKADKNSDGFINKAEFEALGPPPRPGRN